MSRHYILEGREPKPVDLMTWATWFRDHTKRRVAFDTVGGIDVSTVFLGLDHNFGGGRPLLFETMTFGEGFEQEQQRYETWDEAVAGHAAVIERVKAAGNSEFHSQNDRSGKVT